MIINSANLKFDTYLVVMNYLAGKPEAAHSLCGC